MSTVLFASTLGGAAAYGAPVQWTVASGGNDHWYEVVASSGILVQTARTNALSAGGYLATITSAGENSFIAALAAQNDIYWIGATDEAVEGTFRWMDGPEAGQLLTFIGWGPGQPDNFQGDEDYAVTGSFGNWNDLGSPGGATPTGYVVEYTSGPPVPEPSTFALALGGLAGWLALRRRS